jgi:hypothetical protein
VGVVVAVAVAVVVAVAVAIATNVLVATAVPVVAGGIATGVGALPPSVPPLELPPVTIPYEGATQVNVAGQSASALQGLYSAWQVPGNEVVVVHTGPGTGPASNETTGSGEGSPPEPLAPPVGAEVVPLPEELPPDEPDPEQLPLVVGWHTKPSPQSVLTLHATTSHL